MIAERAHLSIEEVFPRLRRYAGSHQLLLTEVAQAAIDGTLDPQAWALPPRSQQT